MLKKTLLSEQAYTELLREIVEGDFPPGERLTEENLSARYGVSRTPVRDALARLEKNGLLVRSLPRGFSVRCLTVKELRDLFSARLAVEKALVESWPRALPKAALRILREKIAAARTEQESRAADTAMHEFFCNESTNSFLREIHCNLMRQALPYRDFRNLTGFARMEEIRAERLEIIDFLLEGRRTEALSSLEKHLVRGCNDICQARIHNK